MEIVRGLIKQNCLVILFLISQNLFAQKQIISGSIINQANKPIPFASLILNKKYGAIADSLGRFSLNLHIKDSISVSCIGYKQKNITAKSLFESNSSIKLDTTSFKLDEVVIISKTKNVKSSISNKISKNQYLMASNFIETTVLNDQNLIGSRIETISFYLGYKGEKKMPFRLNVYNVSDKGFPMKNILIKDIIFYPSKKFSKIKINLSDQQIISKQDKIAIGIEILNTTENHVKFDKKNTPIIGMSESINSKRYLLTEKSGFWMEFKQNVAFFELEIK